MCPQATAERALTTTHCCDQRWCIWGTVKAAATAGGGAWREVDCGCRPKPNADRMLPWEDRKGRPDSS